MKIAISCRPMMSLRPTGIGRYTQQLIEHLGIEDQENTYLLYARKSLFDRKRRLPALKQKNFKVKADYFNLGPAAIVSGCDVFHSPSPEDISRLPGKIVVTVHDLIYKTFPQSHTAQTIELTEHNMQTIVKHADTIICISQATRDDLHRYCDFPSTKTQVIYNGVNHQLFFPYPEDLRKEAAAWVKTKGIEGEFLLYVGTIEPRKNLIGILQAMKCLKDKGKLRSKLVIAGMKGWLSDGNDGTIHTLGLVNDVIFLGFVSDQQLAHLYNTATVFIFPSFYEGFGAPILEAMASGCPVITSSTSSCGELANGFALTINPHDSLAIADAIEQLMKDDIVRRKYVEKGFKRAAEFTCTKTARETLEVYRNV